MRLVDLHSLANSLYPCMGCECRTYYLLVTYSAFQCNPLLSNALAKKFFQYGESGDIIRLQSELVGPAVTWVTGTEAFCTTQYANVSSLYATDSLPQKIPVFDL